MLRFNHKPVQLDLVIKRDESTGLPLLGEQDKILDLIRVYLSLPYTVAEYGCGKKCSLIIRKLVELGVPPYALKRGMIMEKDMSDSALQETDYSKRPHALIIENPLYHPKDLYQDILFAMLKDKLPGAQVERSQIRIGPYLLHHHRELQFIQARSHIFPVVLFWDEGRQDVAELVLDPTINPEELFQVEDLHEILHDEEALLLTAPLLGKFRLDERYLTSRQRQQLQASNLASSMNRLARKKHDDFIRFLNGAAQGSIGDPATWTYANNISGSDPDYEQYRQAITGRGDMLNTWRTKLIKARQAKSGAVLEIREKLWELIRRMSLLQVIRQDAERAEKALAPLARLESIIACYRAAVQLVNLWKKGISLLAVPDHQLRLEKLAGISMRLRRRIEALADVSRDESGCIDARALTPRFNQACLETIRQMNAAGLSVFIDKVGNIHALQLPDGVDPAGLDQQTVRRLARRSICHCSHIDTVFDAGQYDGRLGVLAGIEIANILSDLQKYFQYQIPRSPKGPCLMVSAFIGEEMTFTGQGVSMPGSAAVTAAASLRQIYQMMNDQGEKFIDQLAALLLLLKNEQQKGTIELVTDFREAGDTKAMLAACFEPTCFFSPHTYERHIEQGPVLNRRQTPLALVSTIMGIHQEDFFLKGALAEPGALAFTRRLRELVLQERYRNARITVGILKGQEAGRIPHELDFGLRLRLEGERNHAGATLMQDRRDPGVAAARLVAFFSELIEKHTVGSGAKLRPVTGEIALLPGSNRNVIPGSAAITLGVKGQLSEEDKLSISRRIQSYILGALQDQVAHGGEGITLGAMDPINFISTSTQVQLSIDLRAADDALKQAFLQETQEVLTEICAEYGLECKRKIEQQLQSIPLDCSGQVLQIERSYGGSHNPDEGQLDRDLLLGALLQLETTRRFLYRKTGGEINLYQMVSELLPATWQNGLDDFISGALHDTCNIAAAQLKKLNNVN